MTLPSGGTWFVWNVYNRDDKGSGSTTALYGISTKSGASTGWVHSGVFSGGTTLYATLKSITGESAWYGAEGKLAAIRIA